jgi:hypothetical protein
MASLPTAVRVNIQFPFPTTVYGQGGISVSKLNGRWVVQPNFASLAVIAAPPNLASKQIWVYDPVTGAYNVMTLASFGAALLTDQSNTPQTIGTGSFTWTVNPGRAWQVGNWLIFSDQANPSRFMVGQVTNYQTVANVTTLTANVTQTNGVGVINSFNIGLSGAPVLGRAAIEFILDGGGQFLQPGTIGTLEVPFDCTIVRSTVAALQVGSIVLDVWKAAAAGLPGSYPPNVGNSIVAADPPTLVASSFAQDIALTGWATALKAGDILAFVVTSVINIAQCTLSLEVQR